jgi:hypothetical protein
MSERLSAKVTSTTTITAVPGMIFGPYCDHISVLNKTDGDVEVYLGNQVIPAIIVPTDTFLAFDFFEYSGQVYIKNSTGTGGSVYIHGWKGSTR